MPDISKYRKSRYLKKEDIKPEKLVTYTSCKEEYVSNDGKEEAELELVLFFEEFGDKGWISNATGREAVAELMGDRNTDNWRPGFQFVLYVDPSVPFGGKTVEGIRVKAANRPKRQLKLSGLDQAV